MSGVAELVPQRIENFSEDGISQGTDELHSIFHQRSGEAPFRHNHQKSYDNPKDTYSTYVHKILSDHQTKIPCRRSTVRTYGACVSRIWSCGTGKSALESPLLTLRFTPFGTCNK